MIYAVLCRYSLEFKIDNLTQPRGYLRRCYHWTLDWANHPQARWALVIIAFMEASFFPIPPDVLLIALALGAPERALHFALLATVGSVAGAAGGYIIGMYLFDSVAQPLLALYHIEEQFAHLQQQFVEYGVGLVLIAGFTPIPFKLITISAGAFGLPFIPFILAALLSRGARFYLEGALFRWGGERIRGLVERYFELLTMVVGLLVVVGFGALWLVRS
ncbi:MAG: YqaA family protein [Mariprofundales bacterium]|nr:YqaA family protein [Mariprofundales bacterium]